MIFKQTYDILPDAAELEICQSGKYVERVVYMGEYQEYTEKKPYEIKESGCNVYVTVICGKDNKKPEDKKDAYGRATPCSPCEKEDKKKEQEGCNVYITVYCDSCDKKKPCD